MTASNFQDDFEPDDFEPDVVDDFVADDFEPDMTDSEINNEWSPIKVKKGKAPPIVEEALQKGSRQVGDVFRAAARGAGTAAADVIKEVHSGPKKGSLPSLLGFEEGEEPAISKKIRESLPEKKEGFVSEAIEKGIAKTGHPANALFGLPGIGFALASGVTEAAVKSLGGGEGLQTLAGVLIPSAGGIYNATKAGMAIASRPTALTQKGGIVPKAEVKVTPKEVQSKFQQEGKDAIKRLEASTAELAKPFERGEFNGNEISKNLEDITINNNLDQISPLSNTKKEFGTNLQNSLDLQFEMAEQMYGQKYAFAIDEAKNIETSSESLVKYVDSLRDKINSLETKPANFEAVSKDLESISKDLGKVVVKPKHQLLDASGNPIEGGPKVKYRKVTLDKKLELTRRINKIVNYDLAEPSIKDVLKTVSKRNKESIKNDLAKKNPDAAQALTEADAEFAQTADKFGTKSIKKIRKLEAEERAAALIAEPSTLNDLKNILPPEEYAVVERQVLERVKDMSHDKAAQTMKEISPFLSENAKVAGENIVTFKDPQSFKGNWSKRSQGIVNELQETFTTGERPTNTLKLMQTKEGYKTVYETLHSSPDGQKALKYLQKQHVDDMVASVMDKNGVINFEKLEKLLNSNETNRLIVRQLLGKEGLKEFERLEGYASNIKYNFELYGPQAEKGLMSAKSVGSIAKEGVLPLLGYVFGGLPLLTSAAIGTQIAKLGIYLTRRMIASPKAREKVRILANPSVWKKPGLAEKTAQGLMIEAGKEDSEKKD